MKVVVFVSSLFLMNSAFAVSPSPELIVRQLAASQVSKDFNTEVTYESEGNICGAEGPHFLVYVQVKRWTKTPCNNNQVCLAPSWETVKTYGIMESEVAKNAKLMDSETCLE